MRTFALAILAALCAACVPKPAAVLTRPVTVEVPVPVRTPLPAELVQPCRLVEPDPACWREGQREFCNGQLIAIRDDYRAALRTCDARMTRLRALEKEARKP